MVGAGNGENGCQRRTQPLTAGAAHRHAAVVGREGPARSKVPDLPPLPCLPQRSTRKLLACTRTRRRWCPWVVPP